MTKYKCKYLTGNYHDRICRANNKKTLCAYNNYYNVLILIMYVFFFSTVRIPFSYSIYKLTRCYHKYIQHI